MSTMRNCIILGSGRSGTSMLAGTLARAGYFMGDDLYPPRDSNPKGFFEDPVINGINEQILESLDYPTTHPVKTKLAAFAASLGTTRLASGLRTDYPLTYGQRWLERVPLKTTIPSPPDAVTEIKMAVQREPFCFKDPRFSYTLPVWRPYLKNTVFLCIFRHPAETAISIVKECSVMEYLQGAVMSFEIGIKIWTLMYQHILSNHRHQGQWMFIHYSQMMTDDTLDKLEAFTGAPVDRSFPDKSLRRSFSDCKIPTSSKRVYRELCRLAQYHE